MPKECSGCGVVVTGPFVSLANKTFHNHCFKCAKCKCSLSGVQTVAKGNEILCVSCGANKCAKCSKLLLQGGITALGNSWHESCFVCHQCNAPLGKKKKFLVRNEQPVCLNCSQPSNPSSLRNSEKVCFSCKKSLLATDTDILIALGHSFHSQCFSCTFCKQLITDGKFLEAQNKICCVTCGTERLADKCCVCRLPMIGRIVKVNDRQWHPECFKCVTCSITLVNLEKIYRKGNDPCCPVCVEGVFSSIIPPTAPQRESKTSNRSSNRGILSKFHQQSVPNLGSMTKSTPAGPQSSNPSVEKSNRITSKFSLPKLNSNSRSNTVGASMAVTPGNDKSPNLNAPSPRSSTVGAQGGFSTVRGPKRPTHQRVRSRDNLDSLLSASKNEPSVNTSPQSAPKRASRGPRLSSRFTIFHKTQKSVDELLQDLETILTDDRTVTALLAFLTADYSVENLLFILDVTQFKSMPLHEHDLRLYSRGIYLKYIDDRAELQVNLDHARMQEVRSQLDTPNLNMFDTCVQDIKTLVQLCSIPRFLNSNECKNMVANFDQL